MVPIGLFDTLEFQATPDETITLQCRWASDNNSPRELLPVGPANLAHRAAQLLREAAGVTQGAALKLTKRIPSAAGLGGASSNAAHVLLAANEMWGLQWPLAQLAEVAAELGSDVPLFLYGVPAIARGRGELLETVRLPTLHFVVVKPSEGLSTASVFKEVDLEECASNSTGASDLVDALQRGDVASSARLMTNDLEAPARRLSAAIQQTFTMFRRVGLTPHMSGSGTSCFASCPSAKAAQQVAGQLRTDGVNDVFAVASLAGHKDS